MSDRVVHVQMARVEGAQLAHLIDDFCELVGTGRDETDPAVRRLTPNPYPGDADAARNFTETTRGDILDRRALDAEVVRTALSGFRGDLSSMQQAEAVRTHDIEIPASDIDSWLRTITALRLVIASRLAIDEDHNPDPGDPRYGVYDWLSYRLEILVQAADELF